MVWFGNRDTGPTVTVLEDFEGTTIDGTNWSGGYSDWSVVSDSSLEGSELLETTTAFASMGRDGTNCERGNWYKCRYISTAGGSNNWFCIGSQDPANIFDNCYRVAVDVGSDLFGIFTESTDGSTPSDSVSVSLSTNTEYRPRVKYGPTGESDNIEAELLDASDAVIAGPVSITDDQFTGGTYGFYAGSDGGDQYDYITETPI